MKSFLSLLALVLITGCAQTQMARYDTTRRTPTTAIEIFKDGGRPEQNRNYKVIAELTWMGPHQDELRAQKYFVRKARALGGDAIIFSKEGENVTRYGLGGGGSETSWMFKSKVIAFTK